MMQRLIRDESGVALGLAVIMIALIGVMGAGLLVFVRNDLEAVVEVNQGQKAFEAADASVRAANRQLLSDAVPEHYGNGADPSQNIDWSYENTSGNAKTYDQLKQLTFDGKTVRVSVQYLPPVTAPSTPNSDQAPETIPAGGTELASGCRYFKVRAYGESGQAKRGVETIYCASQLNVPTAYYTPKTIEFDGNVNISGVSFFARENIKGSRSGSVSIDRTTPALYGDWDSTKFTPPSNYNTTPRKNASNQPVTGVGLAAEGRICADNACTTSVSDSNYNVYDYDGSSGKQFVRKNPPESSQTESQISYPFDPNAEPDLELLKEEAQNNGTYYTAADIGNKIDNAQYPANSDDQTIIYVNANGANVVYSVNYNPKARGTIVVENGNLSINNSSNGFNGIIIVTGDGTNTGLYTSGGNDTVEGFVIADGNMTIRGTVAPFAVTEDFANRPGFYGVQLWSWRELYQ